MYLQVLIYRTMKQGHLNQRPCQLPVVKSGQPPFSAAARQSHKAFPLDFLSSPLLKTLIWFSSHQHLKHWIPDNNPSASQSRFLHLFWNFAVIINWFPLFLNNLLRGAGCLVILYEPDLIFNISVKSPLKLSVPRSKTLASPF